MISCPGVHILHFSFDRIRTFYAQYLPVGDRLGEMFYAVWMVIVSLGILDTLDPNENAIFYVIIIALGVNMTWGLIEWDQRSCIQML